MITCAIVPKAIHFWPGASALGAPRARAGRDPRATLAALAERAAPGRQRSTTTAKARSSRASSTVAGSWGKEAALWRCLRARWRRRSHFASTRSAAAASGLPSTRAPTFTSTRSWPTRSCTGSRHSCSARRDRPVATSDLDELEQPVAAVLLELPERELGGLLPAWDDLVASCAKAAGERGRRAPRRRPAVAVRPVLRARPRRDRRPLRHRLRLVLQRSRRPGRGRARRARPTSSRRRASGRCATAGASTASIPT